MPGLELPPGLVFAKQFRVVRPLAAGGMGAVYVVEQLSTGKQRALKVMLPMAEGFDGERRFEQEARTSSLIPSEHVVDVIDAGIEEESRVPWIAMELLSGHSLEEHLAGRARPSVKETFDVLRQLSHALSAAHDLGVVHRDLKPDNLFLSKASTGLAPFLLKVLDYGLAKVVEGGDSRNTSVMGTPLWMAPEQTQADAPISCATDVWAFGLIAFRMLTGVHYWRSVSGGSLQTFYRELLIDPLEPAASRALSVGGVAPPNGFDAWFERAVARSPGDRFPHAREAWNALQAVLVPALSDAADDSVGFELTGSLSVPPPEALRSSEPPIAARTSVAHDSSTPPSPRGAPKNAPSQGRAFVRAALAATALLGLVVGGVVLLRASSEEPAQQTTAEPPAVSAAASPTPREDAVSAGARTASSASSAPSASANVAETAVVRPVSAPSAAPAAATGAGVKPPLAPPRKPARPPSAAPSPSSSPPPATTGGGIPDLL